MAKELLFQKCLSRHGISGQRNRGQIPTCLTSKPPILCNNLNLVVIIGTIFHYNALKFDHR
jgi:hypothetical protein